MSMVSKPKTMRGEPTIFVWDQYDIYHRKQIMIARDGARRELTFEEWEKYRTPNGRLGSRGNCQLWTGFYHQLPEALDLATRVRDRWNLDLEIIRNASEGSSTVIALFDRRKFEELCSEITDYSRKEMGVSEERQPREVKWGLTPKQVRELKEKSGFWCWECMRGLRSRSVEETRPWLRTGFEGLGSYPFSRTSNPLERIILPFFPRLVEWKEDIPYCPSCGKPLVDQDKWPGLRKWLKYPAIILIIILVLRVIGLVLGREVLFWE